MQGEDEGVAKCQIKQGLVARSKGFYSSAISSYGLDLSKVVSWLNLCL